VKYRMPLERDRRERSRPSSVSVIVPASNAAATLAEQLEALAAQRYDGDWELVIVDNGSTDGTADLARRYRQRFKAFTLVDGGSRRGHSAPRNAGASAARGELLAYCRSCRGPGFRCSQAPPSSRPTRSSRREGRSLRSRWAAGRLGASGRPGWDRRGGLECHPDRQPFG
jgi:cellulose synthase/poly-beta-1,6-N-acetylglucosamine synthase-like glycosyltransferase